MTFDPLCWSQGFKAILLGARGKSILMVAKKSTSNQVIFDMGV